MKGHHFKKTQRFQQSMKRCCLYSLSFQKSVLRSLFWKTISFADPLANKLTLHTLCRVSLVHMCTILDSLLLFIEWTISSTIFIMNFTLHFITSFLIYQIEIKYWSCTMYLPNLTEHFVIIKLWLFNVLIFVAFTLISYSTFQWRKSFT